MPNPGVAGYAARSALRLGLLLLLLTPVACRTRQQPKADGIPPDLIGTWVGRGGPYDGRTLSIDSSFVVMVTGDDSAVAYKIAQVRSYNEGAALAAQITLRLPGGVPDTLVALRDPAQPDEMRLRRPPGTLWVRQSQP